MTCVSDVSYDTSPIYGEPTYSYEVGAIDDLVVTFSGLTNGNCEFVFGNYDLTSANSP